jgi:hypothetical protein
MFPPQVMLDQVGNLVVGPTFVERVFRPGRRSFLDHRLVNYSNGLQVRAKSFLEQNLKPLTRSLACRLHYLPTTLWMTTIKGAILCPMRRRMSSSRAASRSRA